jgi:hypothetical protein
MTEEMQGKQVVQWGEPGEYKGGVLASVVGGKALVVTIDLKARQMEPVVVDARKLRPVPRSICACCGKASEATDEDRALAVKLVTRDFGMVPPPERLMVNCIDCTKVVYELESKVPICNCAARYGVSVVCRCEWRRARPLTPIEE